LREEALPHRESFITSTFSAKKGQRGGTPIPSHIAERGLKTALLKDESLSTLEKPAALTAIVAKLETLQRRLGDLIEFRGIDDKPIVSPRPFG
jgi:hypothetical protein